MAMNNPNPEQALRMTRIIWAGMCMGLVAIAAVLLGVVGPAEEPGDGNSSSEMMFTLVTAFVTFPAIGAGLFMRGQVFKQGWVGEAVKPSSYMTGSIIAMATCEGPCTIGIIFAFVTDSILPLVPAAFAFAVLVLLFPNGKAMQPHGHQYR